MPEGGREDDKVAAAAEGQGARFWTKEHDEKLRAAVTAEGPRNWKKIAEDYFGNKYNDTQCLNRWFKVLRPGLIKGPWTVEEDAIIVECMQSGLRKWADIAGRIPGRLGKQCRERWLNHLDPNVKKDAWTPEEDAILVEGQKRHGNAWATIAELLPGRSENAIKNRWNSATHSKMRHARGRSATGSAAAGATGCVHSAVPHPYPSPPACPQWDYALEESMVQSYCMHLLSSSSSAQAAAATTAPAPSAAAAAAPAATPAAWSYACPTTKTMTVPLEGLSTFIPSVMNALREAKPLL